MSDHQNEKDRLSRRGFLRGIVITAASIPVVTAGCAPTEAPPAVQAGYQSSPPPPLNPDVPLAPNTPPNPAVLRTFTPHEARTVDALTARILPGSPDDPGAREAGVTTYIDNMLAYQSGFTESTYREPPFAQLYAGDTPPQAQDSYETVWVAADQVERYGYQSILSPRDVYRLGVIAVDAYARSKYDSLLVTLSDAQQDSIIEDMVNGDATVGFEHFSSQAFFTVLRRHTAEGMFSDPAYGGNRDMVGWKLIGYPGAQRAYTPQDIANEADAPRLPQSLAQLHPFSPGEYSGIYTVLPVSGSEEQFPVHQDHP
ncbi:MAG: gluconate 2-dehydrogenase subunit 3 family protein [Armatimonadetes bacterium]|nr:gluconate 2-dehydrogenase subunit 3 family protein [Anaerolineae bacterium]